MNDRIPMTVPAVSLADGCVRIVKTVYHTEWLGFPVTITHDPDSPKRGTAAMVVSANSRPSFEVYR